MVPSVAGRHGSVYVDWELFTAVSGDGEVRRLRWFGTDRPLHANPLAGLLAEPPATVESREPPQGHRWRPGRLGPPTRRRRRSTAIQSRLGSPVQEN